MANSDIRKCLYLAHTALRGEVIAVIKPPAIIYTIWRHSCLFYSSRGTPQEVGHQYGEACRDEFQRLSALARETASRDERWFSDIHLMQSSIAELFPRVLQEMAGMAQGANLSLDDVLLNHRLFLSVGTLYRPCCTNIAFLDPEAPLFGKNLDLEPNPDRQCAIRDVTYEDGLRIVHAVVVGELTARDTCMNGSGLTFGGSSVGSVFEQTLQNPPIEAGPVCHALFLPNDA